MIIYKITNLNNNKCYIGKTTKELKTRIKQHKNNSKFKNTEFYKDFKDNYKNFKIEIIESCKDELELSKREKYWILYYKKLNLSYNINSTSIILKHKEETKKLLSLHFKNKFKDRKNHTRSIKIKMYNIYGKYIKTFDSITDCSIKIKCKESSIREALKEKNIMYTVNNYLFAFENKELKYNIKKLNKKYFNILQIDEEKTLVFKNTKEIVEKYNFDLSSLNKAIRENKKIGGYYWRRVLKTEKELY